MKKQALLIFGIFFAIIINISAQSTLSDGEKAIKNKDYDKALAIAKEFIDANNTADAFKLLIPLEQKELQSKKLFEYMGDTYAKMNVGENAILYYAKAEALDSLDVNLKFKAAELLTKAERYKEAVNTYLKIAQIDPKNSKALLEGATILYKAKLFADAAVLFEKYLALESTEDAYVKISRAFLETKNYEKTYQYSTEGLKKYSNNSTLNKNAAISAFGLQKFDEAGKFYSAVPDSDMTVSDLKNAGRAFQQVRDDATAIKFYERVIKKDSTQSSLFMDMGNNYLRNKNDSMAVKFYKAKIATDPKFEPAHRYLGFAYFNMKNWEGAREAFKEAINISDTTFVTNYWLAQVYNRMDSTDQAAEQYSKILKLAEGKEKQYKNEILEASGFLGQRYFTRKSYAAALPLLSKALQLKPGEWRLMEMMGACYHQMQNFDEAIKWYRQVLKLNPKSEVAKKGLRMLSAD